LEHTDTPEKNRPDGAQKMVAPFSIRIIALIAVCSTLYFASAFFIPLVVAVFVALTLGPVVQTLRYIRIPGKVSAALLVVVCSLGVFAAALTLAAPFAQLVNDAPQIGAQLKDRLTAIRKPVESINRVGEQVESITKTEEESREPQVVLKQPGLITRAADDVVAIFATIVLVFVLSFFLLISRDLFVSKTIQMFPRLSDKKRVLALVRDIERDVSKYLLTVALINMGLGLIVGSIFMALEMPSPHLWMVLVALLNFLPYIGGLIGVLASFGVAAITFDTLGQALVPAAAYLSLTVIEGQFVTPLVLGRRFSLNTVVILVSIAFWGFLWGATGVLLAVPVLIVFKVLCERVEGLDRFSTFLSGERTVDPTPEPDAPS
jgi:predicted PurR-regulated permease PerM